MGKRVGGGGAGYCSMFKLVGRTIGPAQYKDYIGMILPQKVKG